MPSDPDLPTTELPHDDLLLVRTRQLDLSYRRLPLSIALSVTVPVVFVWLMRPLFSDGAVIRWFGLVWLASLVRGLLWVAWRRTGFDGTNIRPWAFRLWTVTVVAALAWSVGAVLLMRSADQAVAMMLAIMVVAVGAVGASALASHLPSAIAFIVVVLAPAAAWMVLSADLPVRLSGLAVVVAAISLIATVFRANRELAQLIRTELRLSAAVAAAVRAQAVAEEASRAKSAFLANMSHELRTPLNAILGYSELILDNARDAGDTETITDIERVTSAGRHLLALITDVLDLSKIEAGRMDVTVEAVDIAALVLQVVETGRTLASAGHNTLTAEGHDALGTIRTDAMKLKQVLLNLVSNACKFTSNGRVEIICRRERVDGADWITILVRDSGIGMTPEQVSRLFGQFVQADSSTTKRYGGTGLGLAISREIVEAHGGRIWAENREEHGQVVGARFSVALPAA